MASFWVVNLLHQIFIPTPLPERFLLLRVMLVGLAVVSAGAYLIGLGGLRPSDKSFAGGEGAGRNNGAV